MEVQTPYNGVLYRGGFIQRHEWEFLKNQKGKEIEMKGFLSTFKDKKVAL